MRNLTFASSRFGGNCACTCITAIAAKMARVAYGIVKNGTEYQPFFEQRIPSGSIPLTRAVEALATS